MQICLLFITLLALTHAFTHVPNKLVSRALTNTSNQLRMASSIFDFEVEDINGKKVSMNSFKGKKAFLIVNVASK